MAEVIPITQVVYDKTRFSKVVDTQFRELYNSQPAAVEITVEEFLRLYDELFLDIPKDSHQYILDKEAEYLGAKFANDIDIQALLQEITDLRRQLVNTEITNNRLTEQVPLDQTSILEDQQIFKTDIEAQQTWANSLLDNL